MQQQHHKKRKASVSAGPPKKRKKTQGTYTAGLKVHGRPGAELKGFDVATQSLAVTNEAGNPVPATLNAMTNGAELYQRIGRKCYLKSVHIRGWFTPSGANGTSDWLRLIVYYDAQANGAAITLGTLLQNSNTGAATDAFSNLNLFNRARFQILRDTTFLAPITSGANEISGTVPDTVATSLKVDEFIKIGLDSVYNGVNGGTAADIETGLLGIIVFNQLGTSWNFQFSSRLRYWD